MTEYVDVRTERFQLPIPQFEDNSQDYDVPRIALAMVLIDAALWSLTQALGGKAAQTHTHAIADITGLVDALAAKLPSSWRPALDELTDVSAASPTNNQVLMRIGANWQAVKLVLGHIDGWEATVATMITDAIASKVGAAPAALDTFFELAAALGNDPTFAANMATALNNRLRFDAAQALTAGQKLVAQQNIGATPGRWFISGLSYSTDPADIANDFIITPGEARDHLDSLTMALSANMSKRIDAGWAPGSGNGCRYSGAAIANGTYHIYLVAKALNAAVDIYADPSPVAATVLAHLKAEPGGADYVSVRRIASIPREAGSLISVSGYGRYFERIAVIDRNDPSAFASGLLLVSVPTGVRVYPLMTARYSTSVSGVVSAYMGAAYRGAAAMNVLRIGAAGSGVIQRWWGPIPPIFLTNTSGQLWFSQLNDSGTPSEAFLVTYGWIDPREGEQ